MQALAYPFESLDGPRILKVLSLRMSPFELTE
jgi:hypothetical protein